MEIFLAYSTRAVNVVITTQRIVDLVSNRNIIPARNWFPSKLNATQEFCQNLSSDLFGTVIWITIEFCFIQQIFVFFFNFPIFKGWCRALDRMALSKCRMGWIGNTWLSQWLMKLLQRVEPSEKPLEQVFFKIPFNEINFFFNIVVYNFVFFHYLIFKNPIETVPYCILWHLFDDEPFFCTCRVGTSRPGAAHRTSLDSFRRVVATIALFCNKATWHRRRICHRNTNASRRFHAGDTTRSRCLWHDN